MKAVARFEGTAAPGLRIWLSAEGSQGSGLAYLWLQTRGPEIHIDNPKAPKVSVLVPGNATELGFRLIVSGREGLDHTALDVPLELHAKPTLPPLVTADAGDDQVGVVGHRITLNGIRSQPRERAAYRWIQLQGPEISAPMEEAWIYSFIPSLPGLYRFALVVAADGVISRPDEVRVSVTGTPPPELASGSDGAADPVAAAARERIRQVGDGRRFAAALAEAFESVAERTSLYSSYDDLFSEIARRINGALPDSQADRDEWDRVVFGPLTQDIVHALRPVGLDLTRESSRSRPLSAGQQERLGELFTGIARGFRAEAGVGASAPTAKGGGVAP